MMHLITNATVFAPAPMGRQNVLIAGGKIVALTPDKIDLDDRLGVSVTDAEGLWLTPGFIDGHAHITGGGGESGYASRVPPVPLSQFTTAGVTSVVGLLGTDDTVRTTESLVAQAHSLRAEGLSAWCYTGGYHVPVTTLTGSVKRDILFIDPIIGLGEIAISDHRSSQPTFEEIARLASECHVAGLMTGKAGIMHVHMGDGTRMYDLIERALTETELPARTFNPTHINRNMDLLAATPALMRQGVSVDITAFPAEDNPGGASAAQAVIQLLDAGMSLQQITISSDGGGCLPTFDGCGHMTHMGIGTSQTLPETLQALLDEGVEPEIALPPLTSSVARLLRLPHKGHIAVGGDADILLMTPRGEIDSVMALGTWHVMHQNPLVLGTFETSET